MLGTGGSNRYFKEAKSSHWRVGGLAIYVTSGMPFNEICRLFFDPSLYYDGPKGINNNNKEIKNKKSNLAFTRKPIIHIVIHPPFFQKSFYFVSST